MQGGFGDEEGGVAPDDRAGRQGFDVGAVSAVVCCAGDHAGKVERMVEVFCGPGRGEGLAESAGVGAPTQRAGAVARREGHGFVEEKEFGVVARLHDLAVPVFVVQSASDPGLVAPAGAAEALIGVMQNAAIAHKEAAGGVLDDIASGEDAVLIGHAA